MKGDPLPPAHHVLRQCRQRDLKIEPDGTIVGVYPDAFEPDDEGISVTSRTLWGKGFGATHGCPRSDEPQSAAPSWQPPRKTTSWDYFGRRQGRIKGSRSYSRSN
jgi:hypothetical protein